jgi:predicted RNase H-like HicB family nuclease
MIEIAVDDRIIRLNVAHLPEGVYLATTDDVQGLVAQGQTISETIEIAHDVARSLIEYKARLDNPPVE